MIEILRKLTVLFSVAALIAVGCGGSSGGGGIEPITQIAGQVQVPSAPVPQGIAAQSVPVDGAVVELVQVDDVGVVTSAVLATDTTDANGDYNIELPEGVQADPNLIVQVNGGPADGLRAQAVDGIVDIDVNSEYVLQKLTSGGNTLANVTNNEVLALSEVVAEFDVNDAPDISTALNNLETMAADTVDPIVDTVNEAEGDSSSVAGDYHFVDFAMEISTAPQVVHFVDRGTFTLQDQDNGEGVLRNVVVDEFEAEQFASPNGTGGANYTLRTDLATESDPGQIPFQLAASGVLTLLEPATEDIDEVDRGTREPAAAHRFFPINTPNGGGASVAARTLEETEYGLTPGGALDLTNELGGLKSQSMIFTAPQAPISNSTLNGAVFGFIGVGELYASNGARELFGDLGTVTVTQSSATTGTLDTTDDIVSLFRTPNANDLAASVAWDNVGPGGVDDPIGEDDGDETVGYTLNTATGAFAFTGLLGTERLDGFIANGGDLMVLGNTESSATETENGIVVGVRLGTSNPTVDGKMYRVFSISRTYGTSGSTSVARISDSTLTVTGTNVSLDIPDRVWSKDNDLATNLSLVSEDDTETGTLSFDGSNGQATVLIDGTKITGFFNSDGSMGVFRFADSDLAGTDNEGTLGLVVLIQK